MFFEGKNLTKSPQALSAPAGFNLQINLFYGHLLVKKFRIINVRKANLVRRLRATQFAAKAGSLEVNSRDYITEGPKKSREETNIAVLQTAGTRCLCNAR